MRRLLLTALAGLPVLSPAAAQTTDSIFAGWRWTPQGIGSRPAGFGGAFVALADGAKAAYVNPAGLTQIPVKEIGLSSGRPWFAAAGGRRSLRVAAYVTQTEKAHVDLGGSSGFLESSAWETGLALGTRPLRRLNLGAAVAWTRSELRGERLRPGPRGEPVLETRVSGEGGRVRLTGGLLIDLLSPEHAPLPALRFGLAYQSGFDWSARTAAGSGESRPIDVRRPSLLAAGFAWRLTDRWSFSLQTDLVRHREVLETLRRNEGAAAMGFSLPDRFEPRFGTEFASPLRCGCGVVKLRGGIHHQASGTLRYRGTDPGAAAAFPDLLGRTVAALGGSFFAEYFGNALRLDVDSRDLLRGPELSFGIVWRF
jgi:hypothetical protein